ncbi:hypothetical protein ACJ51O_27810 [Burkholderia pyrrocinia]|uniref:hypothetical protein n=1 Tax=Burkholderia TaxID=32008 RepID=UPI00158EA46B|nr:MULTISPECIES: hypothetical protein [Burkholderia]EKS9889694.1 hypothetical protein [Burkholderia pyrrocinia]EKS9898476.1 hypothetical protein [Burkholderia pyrrocinia]EKS9911012.1 hypothetical protein [Burkholderia pyrrocinia]UOB57772.1 hypothetical protein MRS60_26625 [Burkholderia pyrrocinia]
MQIGIGRRSMPVDRRTRQVLKRTIPRVGIGGFMHAANRADAHPLIEVMSKRRGCD